MNNFKSGGFKKGGSFGGRPSFGGNRPSERHSNVRGRERSGDRGQKSDQEMFAATCTTCGKGCEVPFRPDGQKPVLCRECYAAKNSYDAGGVKRQERTPMKFGNQSERSYDDAPQRAPQAPGFDVGRLLKQMDTLDHKLNQILELVQTPVNVVVEEFAKAPVALKKTTPVMPTLTIRETAEVKPVKKVTTKKSSAALAKKVAVKKASRPAKTVKKLTKKVSKK